MGAACFTTKTMTSASLFYTQITYSALQIALIMNCVNSTKLFDSTTTTLTGSLKSMGHTTIDYQLLPTSPSNYSVTDNPQNL